MPQVRRGRVLWMYEQRTAPIGKEHKTPGNNLQRADAVEQLPLLASVHICKACSAAQGLFISTFMSSHHQEADPLAEELCWSPPGGSCHFAEAS